MKHILGACALSLFFSLFIPSAVVADTECYLEGKKHWGIPGYVRVSIKDPSCKCSDISVQRGRITITNSKGNSCAFAWAKTHEEPGAAFSDDEALVDFVLDYVESHSE